MTKRLDPEMKAIRAIERQMLVLAPAQRRRVIGWAHQKWGSADYARRTPNE